MRGKIHVQKRGGQRQNIKIRYLITALMLTSAMLIPWRSVQAGGCPDLRIVFARGSGGEQDTSSDYLEFRRTIEDKLATTNLDYEFTDLEYPAIGIGFENLSTTSTTLGAFFSGGEAYEFGESMWKGVENLKKIAADGSCPNTKYVLGGYSQGAMVLLNTLSYFSPERLIYAATFGDPKIYLPEGEGLLPAACRGENLSDYRMYVPDCQAYKGILGAYIPYEPDAYKGKLGTWCNKRDILCSSRASILDHTGYVSDGLYEDASRVIFAKIAEAFGLENRVSSPHDTAILIDSTGSMESMLEEYKAEALRLAKETLDSGGRVALFDYRDLDDPYDLTQHCGFENCTMEMFERELQSIQADGGGDDAESLLSASFHTMETLNWKQGSTKSLVILTDANFLSPDRDGMTFDEVVALSKRIDPVNFYIITTAEYGPDYAELAAATDGRVVTNFEELSLLTDYIMERYDSLPRVEEPEFIARVPALEILDVSVEEEASETDAGKTAKVTVKFVNDEWRTIVILNGRILGATSVDEATITGIDMSRANSLTLVVEGKAARGEPVTIVLSEGESGGDSGDSGYGRTGGDGVPDGGGDFSLPAPELLAPPATGRR